MLYIVAVFVNVKPKTSRTIQFYYRSTLDENPNTPVVIFRLFAIATTVGRLSIDGALIIWVQIKENVFKVGMSKQQIQHKLL